MYEILCLKIVRLVVPVSEVLLEYLIKRTLNVHRILSDIPSDVAVDFKSSFDRCYLAEP